MAAFSKVQIFSAATLSGLGIGPAEKKLKGGAGSLS